MLEPAVLVALFATLLVGAVVARRSGVPSPVVLVILGALLTLVPALAEVRLPAEWVLLIFLPVLLYWESLGASVRESRRFLRGILLNGTLLVFVTSGAIAVTLHALGVSWSVAWIIGAALGPTDATAVSALGRGMPHRMAAALGTESLINDGTALVVYALALGTATGTIEPTFAVGATRFVVSFVGGVVAGLVTGWVSTKLLGLVREPLHANLLALTAPFVAYLLAESVHASGVLGVVVAGLYVSVAASLSTAAHTRQQGLAFWSLLTYLLNGALFVLVGVQLPSATSDLTTDSLGHAVILVLAAWAVMLVVRYVFGQLLTFAIRALDRRPVQRTRRSTHRQRIVNCVAGMRGAVSLAVALSVPEDLPGRDLIVFVTAMVVVVSLAVQGLALPHVMRWARLPEDTVLADEYRLARFTLASAARDAIPELARTHGLSLDMTERMQKKYDTAVETLAHDDGVARADEMLAPYRAFELALLDRQRVEAVELRRAGTIDDSTFRALEGHLDVEVVRLLGPASTEG